MIGGAVREQGERLPLGEELLARVVQEGRGAEGAEEQKRMDWSTLRSDRNGKPSRHLTVNRPAFKSDLLVFQDVRCSPLPKTAD